MVKKYIFYLLFFLVTIPIFVDASANSLAKVGDKYYDSLAEAIANASSTDTIMLTSNVVLADTLQINKTVNIDLNGKTITAPSVVFQVQGGTLNVTGSGTIKETEPNYGAIKVIGSDDPNDSKYSVVSVGKDVTLEGWSGIFITHENSKSYGVAVNLDGKINAVDDVSGGNGAGVYVNGNIKHQSNAPVINISDNAEITSTGNGLYIAGYTIVNIGDAYISGMESGIGIKSGKLNIDGATIECLGEDKTPTEGYNNGIKPSGVALQIESNNGYAGNMEINIKDGLLKSKSSNVVYEYIGKGTTTQVNSFDISGGTFTNNASKDVFLLSNSFKGKNSPFITGGKYSSDPSTYLKSGYTTALENNFYHVTKNTMKEVEINSNSKNNNSLIKKTIILLISIILIISIYLNRKKIFTLFKN